ncbi:unnamed protein product [Adineta steineri]|uniref:Uncharacterized protein n=1 Tax=Adineta steineri TaxID=433720 RepID=A0A815LRY1_9BILA|nr:unnamed protein product [Adineta steineri]CAF1616560.1 unnamed protein product [Adineta steineri]
MSHLTVINWKEHKKKLKNNDTGLLIHYHYLNRLNLTEVNDDDVEQFLLDTKTALAFNLSLTVEYRSL